MNKGIEINEDNYDYDDDVINIEADNVVYKTETDYNKLNNKPSINGTTLEGDIGLDDLNIQEKEVGKGLSTNDFSDEDKNKLDSLENYDDSDVRGLISENSEEILSLEQNKANKNEIPDVSNFITNTVDNLVNYYLKSESYNKTEVNNLIGAIQQFHYEIVQTLPTSGENNILYLLPKTSATSGDVYDEYVYANNSWELIGSTQIDLTGYAKENWVNAQIADFLTEAEIRALLPTKTSELINDSEFATESYVNQQIAAHITNAIGGAY